MGFLAFFGLTAAKPSDRLRKRAPGQSDRDWLMGASATTRFMCEFDDDGLRVVAKANAASVDAFDADSPPRLAWDGVSFGYGLLGSKLTAALMPDIVVRPTPVVIAAPVGDVWDVLLDFDAYKDWNPFHRNVRVVNQPGGTVAVNLTVDLGPLLGIVESEETVYYVDERRHIFAYGIGREGPSCLRVVWLEPMGDGSKTIFNSWDTIGGVPAIVSRGHIHTCVLRGFEAQHRAIRDRCHLLQEEKALQEAQAAAEKAKGSSDESAIPSLGVCVVTGGCGFLGSHIARLLASLEGLCSAVHVIDVQEATPALLEGRLKGVTVHHMSITDEEAVACLFRKIKPSTVFHVASLIDLRCDSASNRALDAINVRATSSLLATAAANGCTRFAYTSTIEYAYEYNRSAQATEDRFYPVHPTNGYQRTKIEAERLVLDANCDGMTTVAVRPAHIFGDPLEDDLRFLGDVTACFGEEHIGVALRVEKAAAKMSMVHVENCALVHILAACRCRTASGGAAGPKGRGKGAGGSPVLGVAGRKFNAVDFDENIISIYRAMQGKSLPWLCLPYWFLFVMVSVCTVLHQVLFWITLGRARVLPPKSGLHDGALAAARECTILGTRTRDVLGYRPVATRESAIAAAASSVETTTGKAARHLIGTAELSAVLLTRPKPMTTAATARRRERSPERSRRGAH